MSFFDDASLVFLPSGQAGKDGKAYSMKPIPEYGSELVTNGDFATDSDWNKGTGWTISGGTANCDGTQTGNTLLYQNIGHSSNTLYRLQFTISNYVSGTIDFALDSPFFGAANSNGTFVFDITPTSGGNFIVRADENFVGSLDNVSVKEITTSGDFTFSRGSNLTATRVDSNGLIEKGRENLLTYSNDFSQSDWSKTGVTMTSGQSGYDGTNDAWKLEKDAAQYRRVEQTISSISGVYTYSVYAKEGTLSQVTLRNSSGADRVVFDLSDGSIGVQVGNIVDKKIEDIGSGWYRCSVTFTDASTGFQVYVDFDESNAGYIYIQDAQLEIGLTSTEYIESGATSGLAGILEDSPRFDYSGGASCPSLLLEPSRTNLITQSEYFEGYLSFGVTLTTNYGTSPEGLQNSTRVVFDASGDALYKSLSVGSGDETASIYVKGTSGETILFGKGASVASGDLYTLNGNWQRLTYSGTNLGATFHITTYGGATARDIEIYGAQVEEGSYPTSYIPNHSGGSVTREADSCSDAGTSSTFNDAEGVLYAEIASIANDGTNKYISINNGGTDDYLFLRYRSDNRFQVRYRSNNTDSLNETFDLSNNLDFNKIAVSYKRNEFKIFVNGSQIGSTDTSGTIFNVSVDNLDFESFNGGSNFYGKVKQVIVFNTALSDAELTALTS